MSRISTEIDSSRGTALSTEIGSQRALAFRPVIEAANDRALALDSEKSRLSAAFFVKKEKQLTQPCECHRDRRGLYRYGPRARGQQSSCPRCRSAQYAPPTQ